MITLYYSRFCFQSQKIIALLNEFQFKWTPLEVPPLQSAPNSIYQETPVLEAEGKLFEYHSAILLRLHELSDKFYLPTDEPVRFSKFFTSLESLDQVILRPLFAPLLLDGRAARDRYGECLRSCLSIPASALAYQGTLPILKRRLFTKDERDNWRENFQGAVERIPEVIESWSGLPSEEREILGVMLRHCLEVVGREGYPVRDSLERYSSGKQSSRHGTAFP